MQRDGQSVDAGWLKIERLKCQSVTVCIEGEERKFETVTTNARRELGQYPDSRTRQRDDEGVRSMVGQTSEDQDGETEDGHRLQEPGNGDRWPCQ